jgi:hypothetical protein
MKIIQIEMKVTDGYERKKVKKLGMDEKGTEP